MNIPVNEKAGYRPNSGYSLAETHCFYCHEPLGVDTHKPDCVCVTRSVVMEMTVRYVVEEPRSWNKGDIEFHRNESSWCANNDLEKILHQVQSDGSCICHRARFKYVSEATEQDQENMAFEPMEH